MPGSARGHRYDGMARLSGGAAENGGSRTRLFYPLNMAAKRGAGTESGAEGQQFVLGVGSRVGGLREVHVDAGRERERAEVESLQKLHGDGAFGPGKYKRIQKFDTDGRVEDRGDGSRFALVVEGQVVAGVVEKHRLARFGADDDKTNGAMQGGHRDFPRSERVVANAEDGEGAAAFVDGAFASGEGG